MSNDCKRDATEPFAEAHGSDAPDCCAEWTRSGGALEPIAMLTSESGVNLEKMRFKFCPWCGRVRPNDPSSATRPTRAFDCNLDAMAGFAAAHG